MKKRLLSAIISLCLLLTMAPTVAFAASNGVKTEAELRTAIENAIGEKNTITLSEDIELASTLEIPADKHIEIQGDGHSIYRAESWTNSTPTTPVNILDIKGSLTSHNLTIDAKCSDGVSGFRTVSVSGSFEIYDTTIQNGNTLPNGGGANVLLAVQGSSFVMNSGLIQNGRGKNSGGVFAYGGGSGCTFTMYGGEISNNIGTNYGSGVVLYNAFAKGYFYGGKIINNTAERALSPNTNTGSYTHDDKWGGALFVNATDSAYISGELEMYGNKAVYTYSDNSTETENEFDIFCTASVNGASAPVILSELKNTLRICTPQGPSNEVKYSLVRGTADYQLTYDDLAKLELKKLDVPDHGQVFYLDKTDNTIKIANAIKVTLHANNGTAETAVQKVPESIPTQLQDNPFTYPGHTFVEWNTAENGTGDSYRADVAQTFNNNKALYAKWRDRALSSIEVTANKTSFAYGTVLSTDDFTVMAVYDNGEREPVTEFSVSHNTALTTPGTVQVTVTYQGKTQTCGITVDKASQTAPVNTPTLKDRTYTSITLNTVEPNANGAAAQYSKDGGKTWKDSPEFTDLTSGTTYTFAVRYAETDTYNASEIVTADFATLRHSSGGSSSSSTPTNTVSASTASNGKVSLDKSTAKKGDTVTVTVTPDAGYQLDKLTATDAKGNTIAVTNKGNSKYTFTMPDSKVTITPTFSKIEDTKPSKNGFDDVASSAWYADAVQYVTDKGLMNGTGDNQFSPNASTTRGMLMTVLARYAGADTTGGATWYEKGMNWAKANGVSDGTNPNANITREQLVTMLYRYAGSPAANGSLNSFSDAASVSSYAVNAMQWAVANGIVNGSSGKLNPQNNATRAQVAAILMRFCEMSK